MNDPVSKALEGELSRFMPNFPTAWQNANFIPPFDGDKALPFQSVWVMTARPQNPTMGDDHYRQTGYLQIDLRYPLNAGAGAVRAHAWALRDHFRRGLSMGADGVNTIVEETPEIGSGSNEGDRYVMKIFVRFYADFFGA